MCSCVNFVCWRGSNCFLAELSSNLDVRESAKHKQRLCGVFQIHLQMHYVQLFGFFIVYLTKLDQLSNSRQNLTAFVRSNFRKFFERVCGIPNGLILYLCVKLISSVTKQLYLSIYQYIFYLVTKVTSDI